MTPEEKLNYIKSIFEQTTEEPIREDSDKKVTVSTHAGYNLSGAIITILMNRNICDKTTMDTLKRVEEQLAQIGAILELN